MQILSKMLYPVGYGGEEQVEVLLVDALREEGYNSENLPGIRSKRFEHWGRQRSESSIVAARVLLCAVCSTDVRRSSHSLVSWSMLHLLWCATVASSAIDSG